MIQCVLLLSIESNLILLRLCIMVLIRYTLKRPTRWRKTSTILKGRGYPISLNAVNHPHNALRYHSPRELRRQRAVVNLKYKNCPGMADQEHPQYYSSGVQLGQEGINSQLGVSCLVCLFLPAICIDCKACSHVPNDLWYISCSVAQ